MVEFEWDEAKAISNQRKHGISFEYAVHVFEDPFALVEQDRIEGGEYRWQTLGLVEGVILLLVAHTVQDDEEDQLCGSSQRDELPGRSAPVMTKIVRKTLADCKITPKQRRHLAKLATGTDSKIDLSDIPELTEKFWRNAVRNPFYRPLKKQLTLRLDVDVVAWLRRQGKGYQTRANALLRTAMLHDADKVN
jgi:uncharacterized DUF497 family protein/uncharacterized protein (DUF4415 family)